MVKFFCANTTPHRVKGTEQKAGDDLEVHPRGTAERLRQLGVIGPHAADLLVDEAQAMFESHTIDGEWDPDDPTDAKEVHDEWLATAGYLRALCTPEGIAPAPEAKPAELPDEDFTIQIYPWPSGNEDDQ